MNSLLEAQYEANMEDDRQTEPKVKQIIDSIYRWEQSEVGYATGHELFTRIAEIIGLCKGDEEDGIL